MPWVAAVGYGWISQFVFSFVPFWRRRLSRSAGGQRWFGAAERPIRWPPPGSSCMNPYLDLVDRLRIPAERYRAARDLSAGGRGARENRGKPLSPEKIEALIWGLSHESPVVRRCCLELLDQHPDPSAIPHIVGRLEDPVPRVRWHAVHALHCDACKPGHSFCTPEAATALRRVAEHDPSSKVQSYARQALSERGDA